MDLRLTPSEVEGIGSNRYLRQGRRLLKMSLVAFLGLVLAMVVGGLVESGTLSKVLSVVILLGAFAPFVWMMLQSSKAGKAFRREWEESKGRL